jgi:type IV secretion system protein VirB10
MTNNMDFESVVPAHENRHNRRFQMTLIAVVLGVLAAVYYFSYLEQGANSQAPKQEEFKTTQLDQDYSFNNPSGKSDNRLVIAPPPPEPPKPVAPVVAPAAPVVVAPVPPVDDGSAKRRAEEEAEMKRRLESPMIVVGGQGGVGAMPDGTGGLGNNSGNGSGGVSDYKEDDPNRRFASAMSSQAVETVQATQNKRIDALIPQGTIIRGVLETAIQSDLPGMVRAKLSEDVYSFDGRRVLLARDTMLTGTYRSGIARGQTRILIIWTRALRADGTSVALGSYGTDDLGRSGLTGEVDNHYLERFGSAAALSIIGGVSSFIAGLNIHGQSESGSSSNSPSYQAQSQAQQSISQTMSDMANTALRDSINIPPTINVDQGTPIAVFIQRDLDFSSLYESPVKEALDELRRNKYARSK